MCVWGGGGLYISVEISQVLSFKSGHALIFPLFMTFFSTSIGAMLRLIIKKQLKRLSFAGKIFDSVLIYSKSYFSIQFLLRKWQK